MVRLTPQQEEELHTAICRAFTADELERTLRFKMADDMFVIVANGSFSRVVFELIGYYTRCDTIEQLISVVVSARPRNRRLIQFVKGLGVEIKAIAPPTPSSAPAKARRNLANRRRLQTIREAVLGYLSWSWEKSKSLEQIQRKLKGYDKHEVARVVHRLNSNLIILERVSGEPFGFFKNSSA